ncbi:putative short-chain dehydrogenase/reductase family protein [Sphingomonas sp. LH128]|jgi:short-subunit dehydrogenase|uniref:Putative short-chain dehydrogenase/reductase family protein n=1 Tax=Novosphingobium resinovorum TaxID=158500 RepID=A0A031JKX2_9SPHN|nr:MULTISPECIES: SDR family NAD(P)-dependent oxidoreductase [Sphingomonadaceae]EJU10827.1 putative short-chain dehydrogenase/reductase family protein [Sphingomonas sp. LH128]EZP73897.1 putative short-chain dehydrogenase/reductase family protein [Novosphingobium resinovorum]
MTDRFRETYGPTALVTGASSGIGLAFAEELADRGFHLVLTARRTDRLDALAERLASSHGTRTTVLGADLGDPATPARILEATEGTDIGLVVSNAGFNIKGAFEAQDPAAMARMLTVNCHAPMQLAHGLIPRLKARASGGLIFTASVEGLIGCPYSAAYSATKALVVALGEALWGEMQGTGVDVLTLCPGATETEATAGMEGIANLQSPAEVARLALDNVREGPTFVPHAHYRTMFDALRARPRREALAGMAEGMRQRLG